MLSIYSKKISNTSATVYWRSSSEKSGIIHVSIPYETPDSDIISELVAINYLVIERKIFGFQPLAGNGLVIEFSKGAIKKILNEKTVKKELIKYAAFIPFFLGNATLKTHKKTDVFLAVDEDNVHFISVNIEKYTTPRLKVHNPLIGDIEITNHSVLRYLEKINSESGCVKNPLKSLALRMKNTELIPVTLPEKVNDHKLKKYGKNDDFSVWKHPTSTLNFGLAKTGNTFFLVTVFINKQ